MVENFEVGKREKAVAFVVARLSSSRLPAKQFRKIGEVTIIQRILDTLETCRELDRIVIATVDEEANRPLKEYADTQELACYWYRGNVDHVTTRLRCAAEHYHADICLLISADCPLVDAEGVDLLVASLRSDREAEALAISHRDGLDCMLEGVHVARLAAWQRADDLSVRPEQKEHQFPILGQQPQLFNWAVVDLPDRFYAKKQRLSVDTMADLQFMNAIYGVLSVQGKRFSLENALNLLEIEPALRKINGYVYQRCLIEQSCKVLFIVDAGGKYGFGHISRSAELAAQLVERKGWIVEFAVDDNDARSYLESRGFRVSNGTIGRPIRTNAAGSEYDLERLCRDKSLLVLDIFDQRDIDVETCSWLFEQLAVVSIGNSQSWIKCADMLIMPGLCNLSEAVQNRKGLLTMSGLEHVILRREVSSMIDSKKDIDLLVYLHSEEQRRQIKSEAEKTGLRMFVIDRFAENMATLLARSRIYLSGFGTSSYEALALQVFPLCWPHSDVNHRDAEYFYSRLGIDIPIVKDAVDVFEIVPELLFAGFELPVLEDGCERIIKELTTIVSERISSESKVDRSM